MGRLLSIDMSEVGSGLGGFEPAPFCRCGALLDQEAVATLESKVCEERL
jgi:hypothetical protein